MSLPIRSSWIVSAVVLLALSAASRAGDGACVVGQRVIVEPGHHPATVLAASGASCKVHYEDGAFGDGWTYQFNIQPAGRDAANAAAAAGGPQPGKYTVTIGAGLFQGYLVLRPSGVYEMLLPGGKSGGNGTYRFDAGAGTVTWLSGPLTDPGWDGTQRFEADGKMRKIRIGKRAVATLVVP